MILSVSRRTDIPCYYSGWFMNRLAAASRGISGAKRTSPKRSSG
ncbi:MAG: DUF1848 family protein [Saccharofermentanales bacterium]